MPKITTKTRIQAELSRITALFDKADANARALLLPALENCAFMAVTLRDLQTEIAEKGATEVYTNGRNQSGVKVSAAVQAYNQILKNFNGTVRTLLTMLPPEERPQAQDKLTLFLREELTPEEKEAERKEREAEADYWAQMAGELRRQYE